MAEVPAIGRRREIAREDDTVTDDEGVNQMSTTSRRLNEKKCK